MPSIRSRVFVFILKYRHLLRFKKKRTTKIDGHTSITELRNEVEKGAEFFGKLPREFTHEIIDTDNVSGEWIIPPGAKKDRAVLYFHGGGLVCGSARSHRGIVAKFVKHSGISAFVFDYSLAPERPFPHGLNDSISAYRYLLSLEIKAENIVFMGDSGGGNLCLALLQAGKKENIPLPAAVIALSPWLDLKNEGDSFTANAKSDTLCWKDAQTVFAKYYAGENDPGNPLISPLYGDLSGLPPHLLYTGGNELLRDDTVRYAESAQHAGTDVTLHVGVGMFHCYPACAPLFPEATTARDEICTFIRKYAGNDE